MTVCERIDSIIQERGISRRLLAIGAGISPSTLQSAMQRNKDISLDLLVPIAQFLKLSVGYLKGEDEFIPFHYDGMGNVYDECGNNITDYFIEGFTGYEDRYTAISKNPEFLEIKKHLQDEHGQIEKLLKDYFSLNDEGKNKAVERVEELTEIPRYKK